MFVVDASDCNFRKQMIFESPKTSKHHDVSEGPHSIVFVRKQSPRQQTPYLDDNPETVVKIRGNCSNEPIRLSAVGVSALDFSENDHDESS